MQSCPVCHSKSVKESFTHKKWGVPCLLCSDCTHAFSSKYVMEIEDTFSTNKKRAHYYLDAVSSMKIQSIMDIGTPSDFFFLKNAHVQFPSAKKYALDLYPKEHPYFVEMYDHFPEFSVDLCTAFHVMEHVESLHTFIDSVLSKSKYFIIEVPNCNSPEAMLTSSTVPHTHFFNITSLKALFEEHKETEAKVNFFIRHGLEIPIKRGCLVAYSLPDHIHLKSRMPPLFRLLHKSIYREI